MFPLILLLIAIGSIDELKPNADQHRVMQELIAQLEGSIAGKTGVATQRFSLSSYRSG
jgi:hypothetical protein